ncbi:MAG: helix-turn-helix domain-containing protein, partial [Planctomycetes bacterium]|nr:helix-turn-helix domain-containing protein [Planctomycetota bacterium]
RRRFTATVGMPPRRCEILARLGRARELLAGGATVAAAAAACGFASPFYFSRRFKAAYGVAPSACMA